MESSRRKIVYTAYRVQDIDESLEGILLSSHKSVSIFDICDQSKHEQGDRINACNTDLGQRKL